MKSIIAALALITTLFGSTAAFAGTWSLNHTIKSLEPASGGWSWVRLDRPNDARSAESCTTDAVVLRQDLGNEEVRKRIYSTLLAALLSGRKVDIIVTRAPNGHCAIERVRIKN